MEIIDAASSEVQNATSENIVDMLMRGGRIESDVDNQLIINVAFKSLSVLKSIIFTVPNRGEAPLEICLFADRFVDFDSVEDYKPNMRIDLTKKYTGMKDQKIIIPLDRQFMSVSRLGIYIPEGGEDKTILTRLTIDGSEKTGGIRRKLERC